MCSEHTPDPEGVLAMWTLENSCCADQLPHERQIVSVCIGSFAARPYISETCGVVRGLVGWFGDGWIGKCHIAGSAQL